MLFLMNPNTALLILALLMISSCTRRPVQKDVILNNDPADRTGQHRKMVSSPGAADATYELQFIDTMVSQHETAIDAAQLAATRAQHTEIKQFAREFIEEQRKDITAMADALGMVRECSVSYKRGPPRHAGNGSCSGPKPVGPA